MPKTELPWFDDFANDLLSDEKLNNALAFASFLYDNGLMALKTSKYFWSVKYKGTRICTISLRENSWWIRFFGRTDGSHELLDRSEAYMTDEHKNFILDRIREPQCRNCRSYIEKTIFGKTFEKICWCTPIMLFNPSEEILEYAEEITLIARKTADVIAAEKTAT